MSTNTMVAYVLEALIPLALLVIFIILFYKRTKMSLKPFGIGVLIFFVFSQVLEKLLHLGVLTAFPHLVNQPLLFATYGALAAGVFEEVGRYIGFRFLLKRFRAWKDGVSYGLGHGGIEMVLVGTLLAAQTIAFGVMVNSGQFTKLQGQLPAAMVNQILASVHAPGYMVMMGGLERIFALAIQLALSLIVLYGVKERKSVYLLIAIVLHAAFDFTPALYQAHYLGIVPVEIIVYLIGFAAIVFFAKSKAWFEREA